MKKVILHRSSRVLAGHPWIFSNEIAGSPKTFEPGSLVEVLDTKDIFLGIGYINPNSLIAVRLLTRQQEPIDKSFFERRIAAALARRKQYVSGRSSYRVIFSESDSLPGLIVDRFGDAISVQILTLGMEHQREVILAALDEVLSPETIVLRNDSKSRALEGLPSEKSVIKGTLDKLPRITEGGIVFDVDPLGGQKTGFFLDHYENRMALAAIAHGDSALDLFCYAGAWGLQLAMRGMQVTFVDDSEAAVHQVHRTAELNGLTGRCAAVRDDVFAFLKRKTASAKKYDIIVCDPPAFVKSKAKIKEALRGYRDVNAMCMKLIAEGGILATSSCSHHVDRESFLDMLRHAARDAGRTPRMLEYRSQAKDHPVLLAAPETEYLKCAFLQF
ncbi:MAG: 23S rRNA (cytosine1962-C5)-methyltransferase [Nitrospirae bacterium]|nr:MAG: 23S rRNA (cytosine1962-C5)-methyltransferase [Nitrospirota bacterium]